MTVISFLLRPLDYSFMIYDFEKQLQQEINEETRLLNNYHHQLSSLGAFDQQNLRVYNNKRGTYYASYRRNNGKPAVKYLGKQAHPMVQAIQQRYYYDHAAANLESNLKEMNRLAARYKPIDPNRLRERFPKAYQFDAPVIFKLAGTIDERDWAKAAQQGDYCASESHPEHLTQIAADGHYVRSKSEVIITNILLSYDLPIRHEEEGIFGGMTIAPDFTVYSEKLHREIIWEHFGLMNDPRYRNTYQRKMAAFAAAGYYPYFNLITTFDDAGGNIDSRLIEKLVQEFFL